MTAALHRRLRSARTIAGLAYTALIEAADEAADADANPEMVAVLVASARKGLVDALREIGS